MADLTPDSSSTFDNPDLLPRPSLPQDLYNVGISTSDNALDAVDAVYHLFGIPTMSMATDTLQSSKIERQQCDWMLDSGTTHTMCPFSAVFITYQECRRKISMANDDAIYTKGFGDVILDADSGHSIRLKNVWHAPDLSSNHISVSDLGEQGYSVSMAADHADILLSDVVVATAPVLGKQYRLTAATSKSQLETLLRTNQCSLSSMAARQSSISIDLAHRRACNAGEHRVKNMMHHSTGINIKKGALKHPYTPCIEGKSHALPFAHVKEIKTHPGEKLRLDVCGPVSIATLGREHYFLTVTDDASRFCRIFLIKSRDPVLDSFMKVETYLHIQFKYTVKHVVAENAKEHSPLARYLEDKGIEWHPIPPNTSELNGVAEMKNRYLLEPPRAVMIENQLPKHLWGEILHGVNYMLNRLWHSKIDTTPSEALHGKQPDVSNLRALGCQCWHLLPVTGRDSKLFQKMSKGRLVGYHSMSYRIYDLETRKIARCRHVVFHEMPATELPSPAYQLDAGLPSDVANDDVDAARYLPREFLLNEVRPRPPVPRFQVPTSCHDLSDPRYFEIPDDDEGIRTTSRP